MEATNRVSVCSGTRDEIVGYLIVTMQAVLLKDADILFLDHDGLMKIQKREAL